MNKVTKGIEENLINLLYFHKSEKDKPILITESESLYHFTFKRIFRGIETTTGCTYDKESIQKMIEQDKLKLVNGDMNDN